MRHLDPLWQNPAQLALHKLPENKALFHEFQDVGSNRVRISTSVYRRARLSRIKSAHFELERGSFHYVSTSP
jgi:hypothetical protein